MNVKPKKMSEADILSSGYDPNEDLGLWDAQIDIELRAKNNAEFHKKILNKKIKSANVSKKIIGAI